MFLKNVENWNVSMLTYFYQIKIQICPLNLKLKLQHSIMIQTTI